MSRTGADLTPVGPVGMLDRAFSLAREGGVGVLAPSWAGGGLLAAAVIGVYYVERVEGIHTLRPFLALALALAWWGRAWLLGRAARRMTAQLFDAPTPEGSGRAVDVLRTSLVVGLGLWVWSWFLVLGSLGGALGVVLVSPILVLRGLGAPSWIARSACTPAAGFRGFFAALADTNGRRVESVGVEAMMLTGAIGLALNLYAATFVGVLIARSFIGLEIATLATFLSPSNVFLQLVIGALAMVLLEPLRAAVSAASFVDARVREEGLDLRASVEDAIRHATERRRPRAAEAVRAALVVVAVLALGAPARAQDEPPPPALGFEDPVGATPEPVALPEVPVLPPRSIHELGAEDREAAAEVERILARAEFREFEDHRGEGLRHLFERLFEWLFRPPEELPNLAGPELGSFGLPGAWFFLAMGGGLLLLVLGYLALSHRREKGASGQAERLAATAADLRDRPPSSLLDEAAALAEAGRLRDALRALYLATLVALDRRRLITFDPHRTNWHYLRQMPGGAARDAFRQLTRLFDHKWYGQEDTTREDYERCRALADAIVAEGAEA